MSERSSLPALTFPAVLVLALLSAVAPLATDMYLPGLPTISEHLQASPALVQITLTAFLVGLAAGQLLIGPLSDRYGRRGPLLIGTGVCVAASAFCAIAPDIHALIWGRALQGLGGGAGVVLARAVIADRTRNATEAARLFQLMMVIGGLAPVLAPMVGTGIVALAGWRAVFVVTTLLSALSLFGILRTIDESLPSERRTAGGFAALFRAMAAVVQDRGYLGYTLTVALSFMMMFAYISASPFVFQQVLGLSPAAYATAFGVNAIGIALVSSLSARLVGRISPRRMTIVGLGLIVMGSLATLGVALAHGGAMWMLPCIFVSIASAGLVFGNASALAIARAPDNAGTASAVLGALQFCLGGLASPLVGLGGKDTALPMAFVMLGAAVLATLSVACLTRAEAPSGRI